MKVGIAFDLVPENPSAAHSAGGRDDQFEEFDKPETVEAIATVLRTRGHDVVFLGDGRGLIEKVLADPPDLVWNMAEGEGIGRCREARVPAFLEMLGIPYTGSDSLTLAATLDKNFAKTVVSDFGCTPRGVAAAPDIDLHDLSRQIGHIPPPYLLKPSFEGSSKGIRSKCLAHSIEEAVQVFQELARDYSQIILIEEFIEGDEVTVGIVGNGDDTKLIGVMRVLPNVPDPHFVYSLEVKRNWRTRVRYEAPADLYHVDRENVEAFALRCYDRFGCQDFARIDFRLRDFNQLESLTPYFIEANPLPGLSPGTSDLVILAEGYGIDYPSLINRIFDAALKRLGMTD